MALTKDQSLRQAITHEEAQLAELSHKHNESRKRMAALKAELATIVLLLEADLHRTTR